MRQASATSLLHETNTKASSWPLARTAVYTALATPDVVRMTGQQQPFVRDFSQLSVRSDGASKGRDHAANTCPLSPTRCPFGGACHACPVQLQAKLTISQPGDEYEKEADRVAEQVMRMPEPKGEEDSFHQPSRAPLLQRQAMDSITPDMVPPIVHDVLRSPGQPLDPTTRAFMELRFGHDFERVRVHTDARAVEAASAVSASAYTVGTHVVFGAGEYAPCNVQGQRLLAHELTHVLQQTTPYELTNGASPTGLDSAGGQTDAAIGQSANCALARVGSLTSAPISTIQRDQIGSRVTHPTESRSSYRTIAATFDGREFVVLGDGTEILRVSAQSGRPYTVRPGDATSCGGKLDDSYMNNPRYVGIADNGPIPEGDYKFRAAEMTTFSTAERYRMLLGGSYTDPFGRSLHGGDWGAGRVALNKIKISQGRRGCGNTTTRAGFYLHGGIMPGSSGCIDIGNAGFERLVSLLEGYRQAVRVTVRYTQPAPQVGAIDRALGRFTYPPRENPGVFDRLRALFGVGE